METAQELVVQVAVVGPAESGKTCLIQRLATDKFNPSPTSQEDTAASFLSLNLRSESQQVRMILCDVSGSPKFRSMIPLFFRGCGAVVVVCDVTRPAAFEEAQRLVFCALDHIQRMLVVLVATKTDSPSRQVSPESVRAFANFHEVPYTECSALTGSSVQQTFLFIAKQLKQRQEKNAAANQVSSSTTPSPATPMSMSGSVVVSSPSPSPSSPASVSWARDEDVSHCPLCKVKFTAVQRKHHCRTCGNIFCQQCSSRKSSESRQRQCDACFEKK